VRKPEKKPNVNVDFGLGGFLKGLGSLVDLAKELAEKGGTEIRKEGEFEPHGDKGIKAVYGFSVKLGSGETPTIEPFGNVRESGKTGPIVDDVREPMTDLFDEGKFFVVVAEMPGLNEKDVKCEVARDILTISGRTGEKQFYKEMLLPAVIAESKTVKTYKNGILEVKLWKA